MKMQFKAIAFAAAALAMGQAAWAGEAEAKKWIDSEFQPSTLNKDQQMAEMKWFIDAAKKLQAKGVKEISVVSETITTHEYESKTLAKAFEEITGIKVKHDLIQEGDVVEKLQTSMQSGKSIYDGWISDSDLIGTHYRYGKILNLTDYMGAAGKEWTNPGIDLKDYIGTKFTTGPDGKMYQLPDQGGYGRHRCAQWPADRRMGHPRGRRQVHARGRQRGPWRCDQLASSRLRPHQVRGLDEEIRAQGSHGHDLWRGRPRARPGPDRAADLLVHRLHGRHDQARSARGECRRHAQVAHGARPERPVLEARHAKRLPGRGQLDLLQGPRRQQDG